MHILRQQLFQFTWQAQQFLGHVSRFFFTDCFALLGQIECQYEQSRQLRCECFGGRHPDLRASMGDDSAVGFARDHRPHHIANGQGL